MGRRFDESLILEVELVSREGEGEKKGGGDNTNTMKQ